ncbi:hypothetical protein DICVIV_12644 [Dictyocaulus viviparus]|uniref:Uncharacterized protein n=1 Tax=Dictyocaulus viviparus TaxID=29172 RepID=A0A0D8X9W6_DICVI|nr:hypothetical protein DICVIV_12644 [Dictyocaulus viviparus]
MNFREARLYLPRWNDADNSEWSQCSSQEKLFLNSQRDHHREVAPVSMERFIKKAERARTQLTRVSRLHKVNLNETKEVEIDKDMAYYMWYPVACPRRLANERTIAHEISKSYKGSNITVSVDWDKILKELIDNIELFHPETKNENKATNFRPSKLSSKAQSSSRLEVALPGSTYAVGYFGTCKFFCEVMLFEDYNICMI